MYLNKNVYSGEMEMFIKFLENEQYSGFVNRGIINTYETNKLAISDINYNGIVSGSVKLE